MSSSGAVVSVLFIALLGAGLYFAHQQGYLGALNLNVPISEESVGLDYDPEAGEVVEEGEPEVGESSLQFVTDGKEVTYPTLFPNPRWGHMPIKFYMKTETGDGLTGFDQEDLEYVRQSAKIWEEKTGGVISFEEAESLQEAELVISWFPSLTEIEGGRVVGEGGPTEAVQTGGKFTLIRGGEIFLLPTDNKCVGINRPVHEIGHVLGLGHAPPGFGDIMFSKEISCRQNITQVTVDAISSLYSEPAGPDLVVTGVSVLKKGNLLDVNFTVKNTGLVDSVQTSALFLADGDEIESLSVPSLSVIPRVSPGSGVSKRITNAKVPSGMAEFTIRIDSSDEVAESSEENNEAKVSFQK